MMISSEAKSTLEKNIGLTLDQVCDLNVSGEVSLVKAKTGKVLTFSKTAHPQKIGRGNPLLARRKFTTIEEVNAKIDSKKGTL